MKHTEIINSINKYEEDILKIEHQKQSINILQYSHLVEGDDWTKCFQAAILEARSFNYEVFIPNGEYNINDTLIVDNVRFFSGVNRAIITMKTNKPIINAFGIATIENLILGYDTSLTRDENCKCIVIGNSTRTNNPVQIINIKFAKNIYDCIYSNYECDTALIRLCTAFESVGRSVIYIQVPSQIPPSACMTIDNCHFSPVGNMNDNNTFGIYIERGDNCVIRNTIVNNYANCIFLKQHWNFTIDSIHMEERRFKNAFSWEKSKTISEGDLMKPSSINANGCIYKAITSGTTGITEPNWNKRGDDTTLTDGTVTWQKYNTSKGIVLQDMREAHIKSVTLDGQIIGINMYSGAQNAIFKNIRALSQSDYIFKDTSGNKITVFIQDSNLIGNVKLKDDNSSSYYIENTDVTNENNLNFSIKREGMYVNNFRGHNNLTPPKNIDSDYTVNVLEDSLLFVNTTNGNVNITIKDDAAKGQELTIVKNSTDNNVVNILNNRIGNKVLSKARDTITVVNAGSPLFLFIKSMITN